MAATPNTSIRIPPELAEAARAAIGEPDAKLMVLVRAGLLYLAGVGLEEALRKAHRRPGPVPRGREETGT